MRKKRRVWDEISIRNRIFLILTLTLAAFFLVVLFSAREITRSTGEKYLYEYLYATRDETENSMDLLFDELKTISSRVANSARLRTILESNEAQSVNQKEFSLLMSRMNPDSSMVGQVMAISRNGNTYTSAGDSFVSEQPGNGYLEELTSADYSSTPLIDWEHVRKDTKGNAYLLYGQTVKSAYGGQGETIGYLILYIPESALQRGYSRLDSSIGYSYILASNHTVISHEDTGAVGGLQLDYKKYESDEPFFSFYDYVNGEDSMITVSRMTHREAGEASVLDQSGWRIISVISRDAILNQINRTNRIVVALALAALAIAILTTWRIARRIIRPVQKMGERLRAFRGQASSEEEILFPENRENELWELEHAYNGMILRISDLMEKNRQQSEKVRRQELTTLQAQINPHFLYNTLDIVAWLAKIKKQPEIERLTLALAGFFRISLHKGEQFIRVSEELELLHNYVTIEKIRFPEKFEIHYAVESEILPCRMMKIVLQPLVENAIKHGVSQLEGSGHITVSGRRGEGDDLLFCVEDDGVGFSVPEHFLERGPEDVPPEGGYGLHNVHERIRLSYGEGYGLTIQSEPGKGTQVTVRIREQKELLTLPG